MEPLLIVLIIIGLLFIIASCFIMNKKNNDTYNNKEVEEALISSGILKKRVEDSLIDVTDETIIKTEDELSKISNEKIIAVNDFSNMVLDKINNNHEEVVFLYHMLNEKENEIKALMSELEDRNKSNKHTSLKTEKNSKVLEYKEPLSGDGISKQESDLLLEPLKVELKDIDYSSFTNRNDLIIALHQSGKSIVEIAKELGLGQGEVKLVIDLYRH